MLGSKANRGLLPAALPRLRRSHSSLPSIPYYDSQISNSNPNAADMTGYGDALALQPVSEAEDVAAEEGEHVRLTSHVFKDITVKVACLYILGKFLL